MLTLLALMLGLAAGEQQASGTVISADEIAATLKQSIANNTVDQPIKLAEIPGGHKASVALLRRTKAETIGADSRLRDRDLRDRRGIAERWSPAARSMDPKENDLTRLNAGMSHTGMHHGGESRKVKAKDVIIVPAGMAHRFSELDGPIVYLVYRFEPKR